MGKYYDMLRRDIRFEEGMQACMNCGVCTAVCAAAEFYNYDPRRIMNIVQSGDETAIEQLLLGEEIWYCGQCLSCRTRCPRNNTPAYVIMALRKVSQELGYFVESEKGRQQLALKRTVGENVLRYGYCIHPTVVNPATHPEQGPVWEWVHGNLKMVWERLGASLDQPGPGPVRKIDDGSLADLARIFEATGNDAFFEQIERHSERKAAEMRLQYDRTDSCEYMRHITTANEKEHQR